MGNFDAILLKKKKKRETNKENHDLDLPNERGQTLVDIAKNQYLSGGNECGNLSK